MPERMDRHLKILLTGGHGFLGQRVYRELLEFGFRNISRPLHKYTDLRIAAHAEYALQGMDAVIHLAANVGGIGYNKEHPGELFYDNALMGINLIHAARNVKKFVQVGTVCSYPKVPQHLPFKEEDLWNGYPEETNAPYGLAKRMLLEMLQSYRKQYGLNGIYLIPTNLYGPGDNFNPESSHVIPALIKKFLEQKDVEVWGSGEATRDFLHVDDCARAIVEYFLDYNEPEPLNIGSGEEIKIKELVSLIASLTNFKGKITWNPGKPDGQPRRKLSSQFQPSIGLGIGLTETINWYKNETKLGNPLL